MVTDFSFLGFSFLYFFPYLVHLRYTPREYQRPHKAKNMEVDHDNARSDQAVQ